MTRNRGVRCSQCEVLNDPGTAFCVRCGAALRDFGGRSRFRTRRRVTVSGAFLAFVMLVVLVVAILVLGTIVYRTTHPLPTVNPMTSVTGAPASTSTTQKGGSTTTGTVETGGIQTVLERPKACSSSSALKPTNYQDFRAPNLVDGDPTTAWVEGADGPGSGEWVKFEFTSPLELSRIDILNGYQLDESHFTGDARVKTILVEYSGGDTQVVDLLDTQDVQSITALPVSTEWVRLTVYSVYPGFLWPNAALSEVRFYRQE